ncbi:acetamidase/formamidase family protein [Granulicella cerasi]|uniref:Acetamidase/formamidase family protein n=1 Tax=Granulicella cerasi TaxID=741063 RepID=A0ABW1ZFI8_9BACT|nr:acetamidase/formamidase family protein [Granulicella cerasi]
MSHLRSAAACLLLAFAASACAQKTYTLDATPATIAWGNYSAHAKPALTVHSGDTVVMQTASTCGPPARLKSLGVADADIPAWLGDLYDKFPKEERGPGGHILTGPIAIAEADPGDVLEVDVVKINLDAPWSCNGFGTGRGFLPDDFPYGRTRIIPLDREKMIGHFAPGIEIPLHPFFGSMGVAPPESAGKWNSAPPWMHGGNMDNRNLGVGTKIFYPVHAAGALFEAGDGHANQGDGEVDITALETQLTGSFRFTVHKGMATQVHLLWPVADTGTDFITMGFHEDLTKATEMAVRNMITLLSEQMPAVHPGFPKLSRDDAYSLISTACNVEITQLVDTKSGAHVMCSKSLFKALAPAKQ